MSASHDALSPMKQIYDSSHLVVFSSDKVTTIKSTNGHTIFIFGNIVGFKSGESFESSEKSIQSFLRQKVESSANYDWIDQIEGRFVLLAIDLDSNFWVSSDRYGKKDIYYQVNNSGISLSSDMSLLDIEISSEAFDQSAIAHSLTFYGYRPPKKHTIYKQIRRLGVRELVESNNGEINFYNLKVELHPTKDFEYADHKKYKDAFLGYIESTGSTDGNIVYLSSGWDSTSILAGLIHVFGKNKVRGVIGKMLYSERSGNCNLYEMERAQKFADYYGINLTITDLNYASNGPENFSKVEDIFLSNQFHSFTGVNHYLLAEAANEIREGDESIFAGEISDGAHNFGFSQYASIFHPSLDFREYSDKMATYLFGPTFLNLICEGHHLEDPIYKVFLEKNKHLAFDVADGSKSGVMKQMLQSMFIRNGRLPLWSGSNISMLTKQGIESYTNEMTDTYFNDYLNIELDELYSTILHLYNSFHWQGSTVATLQSMCDTFDQKSYLPFWGNDVQNFLSVMPESWGRGLDFNRTKYPLKEMLLNEIDYPIELQKGPHSYTYDVDHSFNHNNELIYHSSLNPIAKDLLKTKTYHDILSEGIFDISYLDKIVDQFINEDDPLIGQEREDLVSLFLFMKTGWYK
jgi:hypothetical protein